MNTYSDIIDFASDILYSLGSWCDSIFEFLSFEIDIPFIFGGIASGSYTIGSLLFGASVVVILAYKIILSLIPLA